MSDLVKFDEVENKIIALRDQKVILDSDVAILYGVETRDINKAVKNNPDKFPDGYTFELTKDEKTEVVENFHNLAKLKFSPQLPKAFTEKGLYMLATILKSKFVTFTLTILLFCFDVKSQTKKTANTIDTNKIIFSERSPSTIKIFTERSGENTGWYYNATEINYDVIFRCGNPFGNIFRDVPLDNGCGYYLEKTITATTKYQGSETDEKTFTIELTPLNKPHHKPLRIKKDCSSLKLEGDYYRTIKYGCCAGNDAIAIYDYQSNLIIEGDVKILRADIPNTQFNFFTAYKSNDIDTNTSVIGTIFYCFNSVDKYQIKINRTEALPDGCEYRVPEIFFYSASPKDNFFTDKNENNFVTQNDEYRFWSLSGIKSKEQIDSIFIKLAFECNASSKLDTITIPIINGKPFGKNDRMQSFTYK
jgi:hypothetical protein